MNIIFSAIYIIVFGLGLYFLFAKYFEQDFEKPSVQNKLPAKTIVKIVIVTVASRILLLALCWLFYRVIEGEKEILYTWVRWDARHYTYIAENGYFNVNEGWTRLAFFPLYPFLVWMAKAVFQNTILSSLIVSSASLSLACVYLYKLVLLDEDEKSAARAVKFLLIFPATIFLGAPYTESLFLFLSIGCLYYARVRNFRAASGLALLAALTRNVGILLFVPIVVELMVCNSITLKNRKNISFKSLFKIIKENLIILIIPFGTIIYLFINHLVTGNAFAFMQIQQSHWSQNIGSYANTLKVTLDYLIREWSQWKRILLWMTQLIVLIIGGALLPIMCKKTRLSYGAYAMVYIFVVFSPTWLLSGLRYYMGLFMLFPFLADITRKKWVNATMTVVFVMLALLYAFAFSMGWEVM